jgi:reductive dehalogenase
MGCGVAAIVAAMRLFSYRHRPAHLGSYPSERLARQPTPPDLASVPTQQALDFDAAPADSLAPALARYGAMFDLVREGAVNPVPADVTANPDERTRHLKAAALYFDATLVAACALPAAAHLAAPIRNPRVAALGAELARSQPQSFAAGLDMILADVLDSARREHGPIPQHSHALVIAVEHPREPRSDEPGGDWIHGIQHERGAVLAAQTAVLLASYLRLLGYAARSHTMTCSEVCLNRLAVASGLALPDGSNPYLGRRFSLAAVTTSFELQPDAPLAAAQRRWQSHGPAWWLGLGTGKGALNRDPYARRDFHQGAFPFEKLKRRAEPTTFIDHQRVPRFPKRADFFARALFGDLGKAVQDEAKNAHYVMKSPIGACARRALGALLLLQFGDARGPVSPTTADPQRNALNVKGAAYWLGVDAAGLCAVPTWAWYSHDAGGHELPAYHREAINLLIDQGHETMEGASGDDWISVAQSMRAYLRFSLLGGVLAEQIRRLGWSARVHSVLDGDVLQPPLLLLSGLGEVSRIGEVILNPYLGPRLKSGTVTTDLPMVHDQPIDFGLQTFCEGCNKCARECPSGAITAGPKVMYNGYEIWKSDAEKCARYRITNAAGGMCGRCMKTCPWNLEGLLADSAARWLAMHAPGSARALSALDDRLGRGGINPAKAWWWDIELDRQTGGYVQARQTHRRGLQPDLKLDPDQQSLAVYPADRMPPPYPVAFEVDREEGLLRYRTLLTPAQHRQRVADGRTEGLVPRFTMPTGEPPVFAVKLVRRQDLAPDVTRYELEAPGGAPLPPFDAGAHIDVVIAPEYLRPYSLAGDPADRSRWVLGVQREDPAQGGRGGSALMHRAFREGRTVFVSRPRNHFALDESARAVWLLAGGIGVTPLITMAHRLHAIGTPFELHHSVARRAGAGFVDELLAAPWAPQVHLHVSDEGTRADLGALLPPWQQGLQLYTCGSLRFMEAVFDSAQALGWPAEALHRELFSAPADPGRENHPFVLQLAAEQTVTEVLAAAGIVVPVKCSDGLCGVCARPYDAALSGAVEHRDHVLSAADRRQRAVLCCVRMQQPGATLVLLP